MSQDNKATEQASNTLRTKFCDSDGRGLETAAQRAAKQECKYPQQTRVPAHDSFEPHGMN